MTYPREMRPEARYAPPRLPGTVLAGRIQELFAAIKTFRSE